MPSPIQLVQSVGIFHGLPVYPDRLESEKLTAMVTGATGVSGYHMVNVLAASKNWSKIYALSCRPPPDNFFADLGHNASRVVHLQVDFLRDPQEIADELKAKIPHV